MSKMLFGRIMKDSIDRLLVEQLNRIISLGKEKLMPEEYLSFIITNYDFLTKLDFKKYKYDNDITETLNDLVSVIR